MTRNAPLNNVIYPENVSRLRNVWTSEYSGHSQVPCPIAFSWGGSEYTYR
jgi:hypothetical protein